MYKLAIIEPVHPLLHGDWPPNRFIVFYYITLSEFMKETFTDYPPIFEVASPHPSIRDYSVIQQHHSKKIHIVMQEDIVTTAYNGEPVVCYSAILKTFWLKIFQRKWRNYFKKTYFKKKSSYIIKI